MSRVGLGVPMPSLLPISGTWALPFTAYLLLLSGRIVSERVRHDRMLGDKIDTGAGGRGAPDVLTVSSRAHANFLENVPFAFGLLAVAELNGGDKSCLNYAMAALLALRVAHVEAGMYGDNNAGWGRPLGYFGTNGVLLGLSGYAAYLVKGYWGY